MMLNDDVQVEHDDEVLFPRLEKKEYNSVYEDDAREDVRQDHHHHHQMLFFATTPKKLSLG